MGHIVYGPRKIRLELCGRNSMVELLMRKPRHRRAGPGSGSRAAVPDVAGQCPADLPRRRFAGPPPIRRSALSSRLGQAGGFVYASLAHTLRLASIGAARAMRRNGDSVAMSRKGGYFPVPEEACQPAGAGTVRKRDGRMSSAGNLEQQCASALRLRSFLTAYGAHPANLPWSSIIIPESVRYRGPGQLVSSAPANRQDEFNGPPADPAFPAWPGSMRRINEASGMQWYGSSHSTLIRALTW